MNHLSLLLSLLHGLGVLSAIHAIMASRTAQGAIAWGMALVMFPYLALPVYWIFGRSRFYGYVRARCHGSEATCAVAQQCAESAAEFFVEPKEDLYGEIAAVELLAHVPLLHGNRGELLIDGGQTFASIFAGIEQAQSYILIEFFIVNDDELGRQLKELLLRKAAQGVRIYFLYDAVGSYDLSKAYVNDLSRAGVNIYDFNAHKGPSNRFQLNFRNHRKIVVVDGHTAWLGGHNVGDAYMGRDSRFGHWRDTHLKIEGPAVKPIQVTFVEDYNWAVGEVLDLHWHVAARGSQKMLVVPSGPADDRDTASLMFVHIINCARKRIWITSPYFVPDEPVMAALLLAGLRGVDVRILIPDKPDHLLVYLAAYSYFDEAGSTGVKFYRYTKGFLHQKVVLLDDQVAAIGTANLDNRSFRLNFEITNLVVDEDFAAQVEAMLEKDFACSAVMAENAYEQKSFFFKVAVRLARLLSPLL